MRVTIEKDPSRLDRGVKKGVRWRKRKTTHEVNTLDRGKTNFV